MRILHTSDWHIGRTFHGHPTLAALSNVLDELIEIVREREVDVVVVAGDVFDSATPAAENYTLLTRVLSELRAAGASVIVTSGNHDSPTRLGFQSEFAALASIHVVTRHELLDQPITLKDADGPVHFYGIPYLEPALIRHHYPEVALRTQAQALAFAMSRIRADIAERGGRSVVVSHCFTASIADSGAASHTAVTDAASDVERDITAGGLDVVPLAAFDGPDYVALGHIHGRAELSERARYSGAPLHYSFSEAGKPRGAWLVDLDAAGLARVSWAELPVPRRLTVLRATLDELLTDATYSPVENDWVSAILTDPVRPVDGMRKLQQRFPHCATMSHEPPITNTGRESSYAERIRSQTDADVIAGFLKFVRNGHGPSDAEQRMLADVIAETGFAEGARVATPGDAGDTRDASEDGSARTETSGTAERFITAGLPPEDEVVA